MSGRTRAYYPTGPETAPIKYWDLWTPIFQKLGIDPANIPDFKPDLAPEGEGPAWERWDRHGNRRPVQAYNVDGPSSPGPAALSPGAAWLGGPAAAADRPAGPAAFLPAPPTAKAAPAPPPAPAATAAWGPLVTGLLPARTDTPSDIDRYRGLLAFMASNKDSTT